MEKISFFAGFLHGTGKILNAPCSVFLWLLFLHFQSPPSFPLLLPSAKFPHRFPSWFLSQFPTHAVVHEYIINSQGKRRSLQVYISPHSGQLVAEWGLTSCWNISTCSLYPVSNALAGCWVTVISAEGKIGFQGKGVMQERAWKSPALWVSCIRFRIFKTPIKTAEIKAVFGTGLITRFNVLWEML